MSFEAPCNPNHSMTMDEKVSKGAMNVSAAASCIPPKTVEVSSHRCFLPLAAQHMCLLVESCLLSAGFKASVDLEA